MSPHPSSSAAPAAQDPLAQIDALERSGVLSAKAAREARERARAGLPAGGSAAAATGDAEARLPRPSQPLIAGVLLFVLAFGSAGYLWLGRPDMLDVGPGQQPAAAAQANDPSHPMGQAQFEGLAQRLAERLQTQPDDAEGWAMLGRSYNVLGRPQDAAGAFAKLVALRPQDAQALADYADALGTANGRQLDGEPERLIERALKADPDHPKALALAGTLAFKRGNMALAAQQWQHALRGLPPDSSMGQQLRGAMDEAREKAGLPPLPVEPANAAADAAPAPAQPAPARAAGAQAAAQPGAQPAPATAAGSGSVRVQVSLAPALAASAAPQDTVFIFARAVAGPKAPLAIQRRQVKDLPLTLTLDDSQAMSPALRLSSVPQVVVGARVSKSGQAMPQPGDLQALSAPVASAGGEVKLEISDAVR